MNYICPDFPPPHNSWKNVESDDEHRKSNLTISMLILKLSNRVRCTKSDLSSSTYVVITATSDINMSVSLSCSNIWHQHVSVIILQQHLTSTCQFHYLTATSDINMSVSLSYSHIWHQHFMWLLFHFEISNLFIETTYVMKMLHYRNAPYITLYIACVLYITLIKSKMY